MTSLTLRFAVPVLAAFAALAAPAASAQSTQTAIFAGGCFWCVEEAFDKVAGVVETTSGYTGGSVPNPTYKQVSSENTGHAEAVQVTFDPAKVGYDKLLDTFWRNVDPLDGGGQFCDRGSSYRSEIFVAGEEQARAAEASKQQVAAKLGKAIKTEITPASTFYPAEDYHQDYHNTNSVKYKFYKWNCGRAQRLQQVWGPPAGS